MQYQYQFKDGIEKTYIATTSKKWYNFSIMPVNPCSENGKPGFKWGDSGKCYLYEKDNPKSMGEAKRKATIQGIATGEYSQKSFDEQELENILKSLKEWFKEKWVDLSRPKPGGGFEPCGREDASSGKYPKCVPASRAARMTPAQIESAVRRKRRAESTQNRDGKKPIYVSTDKEKVEKANVPTNPELYARVKAEAKAKFDVYPSAYANAWLVREYKRRGGGYKIVKDNVNKIAEDLAEPEAALADALCAVAMMHGPYDREGSGIYVGYESAEENDDKEIGVICKNCVLYCGDGMCKILNQKVEDYGKCRFAVIPDGLINSEMEDDGKEEEDDSEEEPMSALISLIRDLLINKEK